MATVEGDLQSTLVGNRELWIDGPPHALFKRIRNECPVHWSTGIEEFPEEAGYWTVTTADDIHAVSRDWQTYSSELGGVGVSAAGFPLALARAMYIGMGPHKHARMKALFRADCTPLRLDDHEDETGVNTPGALDR